MPGKLLPSQRRPASKRINLRRLERSNKRLDRRVSPHAADDQRPQRIQRQQHTRPPVLATVPPDPPPHARVAALHLARVRVKRRLALHGLLLDDIAEAEQGREGVCELDEEHGGGQADESEEVGDGGGDDVGDAPVDGHHDRPDMLTLARGQGWEVEKLDQDVVVDDLDTNVAVQDCGDEAAEDAQHVADRLPGIGRQAIVCDLKQAGQLPICT